MSPATWRLVSLLIVVFLIAVSFTVTPGAQAGMMTRTDTVQRQQVIDDDLFLSGERPAVIGVVNGDVFITGSDATVSGDVNGSLFILANEADIQGEVSGNVFVLAGDTRLREGGSIERSLYNISVSLVTEPDATIGRDLNATAISANLQGSVGRDTRAVIGLAEVLRMLRDGVRRSISGVPAIRQGLLTADASKDFLWQDQRRAGNSGGLTINSSGISNLTKKAGILGFFQPSFQAVADDTEQWLLTFFLTLIVFLVTGALSILLFPQLFPRWVSMVRTRPLPSAGYGALVLINGFLLPILIAVVVAGIVMGLIYLSLPSIAWMILAAALGFLTAGFSIFLLVVTYLSKAIVAFLVGAIILSRFGRSTPTSNRWLALLLGIVLYVLLASVPYLGFALGLIVTLLGLGAIWLVYRASRTPVSPPVAA